MVGVPPSPPDQVVTRCYLARHCDVANPEGVLYGHLPDFPLSEKGHGQALVLGNYLAPANIAAIYSSPLQRAQETSSLLAQELAPAPPVLERPGLVEAEFGRYLQGTRYRDVVWRKPRWWVHMVWPGLVPGDEAMGKMARRVESVILEGIRDHRGGAFVCISHGDPIQAFWATSDGRWPWALHRLQCAKGGLLQLKYQGDTLIEKTYLSPQELAETVASRRGTHAPTVPDAVQPSPPAL
jgi:broad specificity phosphatase PhoE